MKNTRANRGGMTIMEMTIAGVIFSVFIVQFGSIWTSSSMQLNYVLSRANVNREAAVARTMLMTDLSSATAVALAEAPANGFEIYQGNGSTVTYTSGGAAMCLYRHDSADSSDMTVAKLLKSLAVTISVSGTDVKMVFANGKAEVTLDMRRDTVINATP
ncbi:MAG: hypothetical protein PHW69_05615 [Elusimicrobiaceae bacterium]|nr:hypothetical protein [Elusimicrobiaceae bacterium]